MKKRVILKALEALRAAESKTFKQERLIEAIKLLKDDGKCQLHIYDGAGNSFYVQEVPKGLFGGVCEILAAIENAVNMEIDNKVEQCAEILAVEDDDDSDE